QPDDSAKAPCTRTMVGFSCAATFGASAAPDRARPAASARIPVTFLMCFLLVWPAGGRWRGEWCGRALEPILRKHPSIHAKDQVKQGSRRCPASRELRPCWQAGGGDP